MAVFKCKMCGGALEVAENATIVSCDYCGSQQTLPKLNDDKRARLYDRAGHFRRSNEFDKAAAIYEEILNEDNTDAEAYWSLVLCGYGIEYVEDPTTKQRVPTVNRAQFTSIFDDDNYKSAIQYADLAQKSIYEAEAKAINEIQKGILAISQKEAPFDIFICYKETDENGSRTRDSVTAQELYYQLTEEGFKVFFSRITLEGKLGVAYEPYIFAALNSAKIMVVIGTKPEYFNAVWVKNEWSRYLALVKQSGGKKMLIPAYRDMDPYDLPDEFSHLQAQDMSKLGFMQDLIRGIKKIISKEADKPHFQNAQVKADPNQLYDVKLLPYGNRKLDCIKVIREAMGFDLQKAQGITESRNPIISRGVYYAEAERIRNAFVRNGFDVELIPTGYSASQPSYMAQQTSNGGNVDTILRRAAIFIEGKDWSNANIYCEKALDIDPENSQAYIYKLMTAVKVTEEGRLVDSMVPLDGMTEYKNAVRFSDEETAARLVGYNKSITQKLARIAAEKSEAARIKYLEEQKAAQERKRRESMNAARANATNTINSLLNEKTRIENAIKKTTAENGKRMENSNLMKALCIANIVIGAFAALFLLILGISDSTAIALLTLALIVVYILAGVLVLKLNEMHVALIFLNVFYGIASIVIAIIVLRKCYKRLQTVEQYEAKIQELQTKLKNVDAQIAGARSSLLEINKKINGQ